MAKNKKPAPSWSPKCDRCGRKLKAPGAVVFSPPHPTDLRAAFMTTSKFHICDACWQDFTPWLLAGRGGQKVNRDQIETKRARGDYDRATAAFAETSEGN